MIRAPLGDERFWAEWEKFRSETIAEQQALFQQPSANPAFRAEYVFKNMRNRLRYVLTLYSKGEPIASLGRHVDGILDAWEYSNTIALALNEQLKPGQGWDHRRLLAAPGISDDPRSHHDPRSWFFSLSDLNHYNLCFWLVALALMLEIPDTQWQRLLALIGEDGKDILLDRVIATRFPNWKVGSDLLHPKPYVRLLAAIDAPGEQQAKSLLDFVDHWYAELERDESEELWWHVFADPTKHPLEKGGYFGRWCLEAAVVAKVFDMDDSLCLGHESYPGDFLRPEGPSTHVKHKQKKQSFWSRFFPKSETKLSG